METRKRTEDQSDSLAFNGWFTAAIAMYVVIEAVCIAVLMYLWLSK
jgi:acyl dehydratase